MAEKILNEEDKLLHTALRISQRAWAKLEMNSETMSEAEVLKHYIRLCPYVSPDSPVIAAALSGIDRCDVEPSAPGLYSMRTKDLLEIQDTTPRNPTPVKQKASSGPSRLWRLVRVLILDIPLVLLLLTLAGFEWFQHVHDNYLYPQLQDAKWTRARSEQEITYYVRPCSADDMTTKNGADLFLQDDATPEEAYQHQLKHGFSVFRDVISPQTAENLRNHVVSRNRELSEAESIFVIENENRYSFGLGTEEPAVTAAMMEVATNERLKPALEKVLGENPALIEMTAITSSYGAVDQYWHDDVIPTGSAINFARTFGPSYSVFVQLQNTTKEMGATSACPGTHYCSDGPIADFCQEEGFQLVNEDGHWKQGDALLMNMNSYHRGAAHTDPDALDRVMLILTFAPKPTERAESRQMSQGITFSLRWDMWGHTLDDLAHADTAMTQPWATLRSLGLYKPSGASWGVDAISGGSMRMSNADNGFRRDQLDELLEAGGIPYLPKFLQGKVDDNENWYEYLNRTFHICKEFLQKVMIGTLAGYALIHLLALFHPAQKRPFGFLTKTAGRILLFVGGAFLVFYVAKLHVDRTDWAADIKAHHRYASTTPAETWFAEDSDQWPTTFPTKLDVLFETRYTSRQLAMYNDFIDGHPANRLYSQLVSEQAPTFKDYPFEFQQASAEYINGAILSEHGRFLYQAPDGGWYLMDSASAVERTKKELVAASSALLTTLEQEIRFLRADLKYGIHRDSIMSSFHIAPFLKSLEEKLLTGVKTAPKGRQNLLVPSRTATSIARPSLGSSRLFRLPDAGTHVETLSRKTSSLPPVLTYAEPHSGAWISEGDSVEGVVDGHWYKGNVTFVSAHGKYSISYPDGDANVVDRYKMRRVQPYTKGEELDVLYRGAYVTCEIVRMNEDNEYTALIRDTGEFVSGFGENDFRRATGSLRNGHVYQAAY